MKNLVTSGFLTAVVILVIAGCGSACGSRNHSSGNRDLTKNEEQDEKKSQESTPDKIPPSPEIADDLEPEVAYPERESELLAQGWSKNLIGCGIRSGGEISKCELKVKTEILFDASEKGSVPVQLQYKLNCEVGDPSPTSIYIQSNGAPKSYLETSTSNGVLDFVTDKLTIGNDDAHSPQLTHEIFNASKDWPCDLRVKVVLK